MTVAVTSPAPGCAASPMPCAGPGALIDVPPARRSCGRLRRSEPRSDATGQAGVRRHRAKRGPSAGPTSRVPAGRGPADRGGGGASGASVIAAASSAITGGARAASRARRSMSARPSGPRAARAPRLQHPDQLALVSDVVCRALQRLIDLGHPVAAERRVEPGPDEVLLAERAVAGQRNGLAVRLGGRQPGVTATEHDGHPEHDRRDDQSRGDVEEKLPHGQIVARPPPWRAHHPRVRSRSGSFAPGVRDAESQIPTKMPISTTVTRP
jgi:hypothetical protein